MIKNKLIPRTVPFYRRGGRPIGFETVGASLISGWDKMTDDQKALYKKQYEHDWKKLDLIYKSKLNDLFEQKVSEYADAFANPTVNINSQTNTVDHSDREQEMLNSRVHKPSLQKVYEYNNSFRPDLGQTLPSWDKISKGEDWQLLETTLASNPAVLLNLNKINNSTGINDVLYGSKVKHTTNDPYYDELLQLANKFYRTNFKNRADVAAFQSNMGATKVDGIIGPETEALLNFYYPHGFGFKVDKEMYSDLSNLDVTNNTLDKLGNATDAFIDLYEGSSDYYFTPFRDFEPYAVNFKYSDYINNNLNPYTRFLINYYKNYERPTVGPSLYVPRIETYRTWDLPYSLDNY